MTNTLDYNALSMQQKILLDTDGTVTDLIRHFTGEDIQVTKLSQTIITDDIPADLLLAEPSTLLHRLILLTGSKHYLYAESYFVVDRMSEFLRKALLESDIPIGLLWQREKLEAFREIIKSKAEENDEIKAHFPEIQRPLFLTRTYRIYHGGVPLGLITEKFPEEYFV